MLTLAMEAGERRDVICEKHLRRADRARRPGSVAVGLLAQCDLAEQQGKVLQLHLDKGKPSPG